MADTSEYQEVVMKAFELAGLPEIEEKKLEPGTYTNAQIAKKLQGNPQQLLTLLQRVSSLGSEAEKRSILSFAVDMIDIS